MIEIITRNQTDCYRNDYYKYIETRSRKQRFMQTIAVRTQTFVQAIAIRTQTFVQTIAVRTQTIFKETIT